MTDVPCQRCHALQERLLRREWMNRHSEELSFQHEREALDLLRTMVNCISNNLPVEQWPKEEISAARFLLQKHHR